nr:cysteine desulfurase family protein [Mycobacterium montefiorense]
MTISSPLAGVARGSIPAIDHADGVYLDYAATAPLHPPAAHAAGVGASLAGYPASRHGVGRTAAAALEHARQSIAQLLGVAVSEVVLTSGGTEANAMALWGTFAAHRFSGHLVTTAIEHPSVLENAYALAEFGIDITVVNPTRSGHVEASAIAAALRPDTVLVSVMHANNHTGAIQPVAEIAALAAFNQVAFHCDAVQTAGKLDLVALAAGAPLISVAAHKFGGPRGIGALAVGPGHRILPLIRGGPQEDRRRAGTENLSGAMGMAAAAEVCLARTSPTARAAVRARREQLVAGLLRLGGVHLNASEPMLEEIVSVRFDWVCGEALAEELDMRHIYVSTASVGDAEAGSQVLTAMGLSQQDARSTIRYSLGPEISDDDIDRVVSVTAQAVERLRGVAGIRSALLL